MQRLFSLFLISCIIFSNSYPAFAAERTWMGLSIFGPEMSRPTNWSLLRTPDDGDSLKFSTAINARRNVWNDFDGYTFSAITFNSGARETYIEGNDIYLDGNIDNSSSKTQTIALNMDLLRDVNLDSGDSSYNLELDGIVSGGHSISKNGASTLILGGANTYTGATTISEGTLRLGVSGAIPDTSAVTVDSGATLSLSGYNETIASLSGAGTVKNNSTTNATLTLGDATSKTFSGTLIDGSTGKLALTKQGSGTFTLTGVNNYTGATNINAGVLNIRNNTATGTTAGGVVVASTAALQLQNNISVGAEALTLNGAGVSSDGAMRNISGSNSWAGAITLGSASRINSDSGTLTLSGNITAAGKNLTVGGSENTIISGAIGTTTGTLTKDGNGTLTLSGANTYTGNTLISAGTLVLGNNLALQNSALDTSGAGVMNATGFTTPTFGGLTGSKNLAAVITTGYDSVTGITLNPSSGVSNIYSGVIADGAAGMTLTKSGAGTQVLSGANTYTGATTVNAGTLTLDYSTQDNSKISETAALILGGGTLNLSGGTCTQGQGGTTSTTFSAGRSFITRTSGSAVLQMNAITVNDGATIDFSADNIAKTSNNNLASGYLGTWATVGQSNWAKKNALDGANGFIIAFDNYVDIANCNSTIADISTNKVRISFEGTPPPATIALEEDTTTIDSLLQNWTSAATVDTAGKTLRTNGIMIGDGKAGLTIGSAAGDGTLTSATVDGDINLINYSNDELLTVNSVIANNGNASTLTVSGDGTIVLNGVNTYTGKTVVSGGTLNLNQNLSSLSLLSELAFGGSATVNLADGKSIAPDITTDLDDQGTLTLLGSGTISGQVGAAAAYLAAINAGDTESTATFESDVFATTINTSGTANFDGNVNTTTLTLENDGTAVIAADKNLTGEVKAFHGRGTLTLAGGDQAVTGDIGTASQSWLGTINAQGSGTATFGGALKTKYFNITDSRAVIFNDDVETLYDFTLGSDNNVTLADGKDMTLGTGGITSPSGQGTLTLSGAHTITGNIGSALLGNNGLKLLTVGNGAVGVDGNIKAVTVNFAGDNELTIGSGYGITGLVTSSNNGTGGTLTFAGATSTGGDIGASDKALKALNFNGASTLSHNIFATNTYIKSGSTVTLGGDTAITGNLTLNSATDAELDLGLNTLTLGGTGVYAQNSSSTLKLKLSSADYGNISAAGIVSLSSDSTVDIDVSGLLTGGDFKIVESADAAETTVPNLTWDSPLFTITGSRSSNDFWINVVRGTNYEQAALNSNAAAVGRALDNAPTLGDMATVKGQLDSLASQQEITDALDSMHPVVDGANINLPETLLGQFKGIALLRLQDSKIEDASQSVKNEKVKQEPAGENILSNDIWAQVYGDYANQGKRGLSNGYNARLWGMVFGLDRLFMDGDLRLGLSPGFGWAHIRSKDDTGRTRISSYQAQLYGQYQRKDSPFSLDAILAYGYNDYDSSRNIFAGSINRTANAKYGGQQFSTYLEAGYKIAQKILNIIPLFAIDYSHLYISGYTESGADSLNLTVNSQNYDSLKLGVGCRLNRAFESKAGIFTPEFRFRYFYDVINDKQQTLASFAGGGTSFQTTGFRPAPSSFNLGARLEFFNRKNITLLADCNTVFKDNYYETGGSLTFKYSF